MGSPPLLLELKETHLSKHLLAVTASTREKEMTADVLADTSDVTPDGDRDDGTDVVADVPDAALGGADGGDGTGMLADELDVTVHATATATAKMTAPM